MKVNTLKSKKGQGLTEYGIILVLVAVAGIGVFALFGNQIKSKVGQVTAAISGNETSYKETKDKADDRVKKLKDQVDQKNDMGGATQPLESE